jgi:hypothetical protein
MLLQKTKTHNRHHKSSTFQSSYLLIILISISYYPSIYVYVFKFVPHSEFSRQKHLYFTRMLHVLSTSFLT